MFNFLKIPTNITNISKYLNYILLFFLIITILSIGWLSFKVNRLQKITKNYQIELINKRAESDSLTKISDTIQKKLSFVYTEKEMIALERDLLKQKLEGKTVQITNLNLELKELKGKFENINPINITNSNIPSIPDYKKYEYSVVDSTSDYSINIFNSFYTQSKPEKMSIDYKLDFKPVKINLVTKQLSEYEYEIYLSSNSNFLKIQNVNNYVNLEKFETKKPGFFSKFNFALGASITDNPYAVAGIKYSRHSGFIQYDTKHGIYGVEYLFWIK